MNCKVAHLTSAHPRYDTRIFVKQCRSLAKRYSVALFVADGRGDEVVSNVRIIDIGKPSGRLDRMLHTTKRMFERALQYDAGIYHIHDPELLPIGIKLKRRGRKVIFDAHEDTPLQIQNKTYLNFFVRKAVSVLFGRFEKHACSRFDAVVAATPFIRNKFSKINSRCVDINNYPVFEELKNKIPYEKRGEYICYIGYITAVRGIKELVGAMENLDGVRLKLAGKFQEADVETEVRSYKGWQKVDFLGFLGRDEIRTLLSECRAGIVTLHPVPNYLDALPVKMFEYMAAGVPVIASDFPLWRSIVEKTACGLCVDPEDSKAVSDAVRYIMTHPDEAAQMGANGIEAVRKRYNWQEEERKLLALYEELMQ
ncbi:glycosyltransferase family 4 protein [Hydrogenimonas sp.]